MKKHRDSQKRIYFKDAVYFVTCNNYRNIPFFQEEIFCDVFVENLKICKKLKKFKLYAWVLIHNHFHLLVEPNDRWNISEVMFSIKKQTSHDINRVIGINPSFPFTPKARKRLRAFGEGGLDDVDQITEYQRYIKFLNTKYNKEIHSSSFSKFQWQKSYHDHIIRNDDDFEYHYNYIEFNPIKHDMPSGWSYIFTNPKYADLLDPYPLS